MYPKLSLLLPNLKKTFILICVAFLAALIPACPGKNSTDDESSEPYPIGTWAGTLWVDARIVVLDGPLYWNSAWKLEADIRFDEYQDGSLEGTAQGDFFQWSVHESKMFQFDEIAVGHWDKHARFNFDINGSVDDDGYSVTVDELPEMLPNPNTPGEIIDFWDFLYPTRIEGEWPSSGPGIMQGESEIPQGVDYRETMQMSTFREFSIMYKWSIRKL